MKKVQERKDPAAIEAAIKKKQSDMLAIQREIAQLEEELIGSQQEPIELL